MAIPLGLNVYQVLQNELLAREGNRQTLGLGFRLATLESKLNNAEAVARNGRVWKLHHSITPVFALTPEARRIGRAEEKRLAKLRGSHAYKDTRDPTKLIRDEEVWGVGVGFPKTVREFKELQFDRRFNFSFSFSPTVVIARSVNPEGLRSRLANLCSLCSWTDKKFDGVL